MSVKFLIQNARLHINFLLIKICDIRGQSASEPDRSDIDAHVNSEDSGKNKLSKADIRVAAVIIELVEILICDFS